MSGENQLCTNIALSSDFVQSGLRKLMILGHSIFPASFFQRLVKQPGGLFVYRHRLSGLFGLSLQGTVYHKAGDISMAPACKAASGQPCTYQNQRRKVKAAPALAEMEPPRRGLYLFALFIDKFSCL